MPAAGCNKCGNRTFLDWRHHTTQGPVLMLICAHCGAVQGVVPDLSDLNGRLTRLETQLQQVVTALRQLRP
jgi:hypothetical protein